MKCQHENDTLVQNTISLIPLQLNTTVRKYKVDFLLISCFYLNFSVYCDCVLFFILFFVFCSAVFSHFKSSTEDSLKVSLQKTTLCYLSQSKVVDFIYFFF